MTSASEAKIRDLVWQYPEQEGQPFLLLDAGVEMGRLAFHEEPAASIGEIRRQRWTFLYSTRFHPRVTMHRDDSQELVAEYVPGLTGGPLTQGGKVSVCCGAADSPETPVLLLLAWFLRIMDFEMLVEGIFRVG